MTIHEAISRIDNEYSNTFTPEQKIHYLSRLEGLVKREIIDRHEGAENINFEGYTKDTPQDTVLLIPEPYTDAYIFWLQAWIDYWSGELESYNNAMLQFKEIYDAFYGDYHNTHTPKQNSTLKFW